MKAPLAARFTRCKRGDSASSTYLLADEFSDGAGWVVEFQLKVRVVGAATANLRQRTSMLHDIDDLDIDQGENPAHKQLETFNVGCVPQLLEPTGNRLSVATEIRQRRLHGLLQGATLAHDCHGPDPKRSIGLPLTEVFPRAVSIVADLNGAASGIPGGTIARTKQAIRDVELRIYSVDLDGHYAGARTRAAILHALMHVVAAVVKTDVQFDMGHASPNHVQNKLLGGRFHDVIPSRCAWPYC